MNRRRLLWRVFLSSFSLLLFCMAVALLLVWVIFRALLLEDTWRNLQAYAETGARNMPELMESQGAGAAEQWCVWFGEPRGWRCTYLDAAGTVIFDSALEPGRSDSMSDRTEVIRALRGEVGQLRRHSFRLNEPYFYVAVPIYHPDTGAIAGAFRMGRPAHQVDKELEQLLGGILLVGLLVSVLSAIGYFAFARSFAKPIELMQRIAERFGRGDFHRRMPEQSTLELAELAQTLNTMAVQLDQRINVITHQRNEREAILESMQEGVLAIDAHEKILSLNKRAEELLGVTSGRARGKLVQEVLRRVELQRFIDYALEEAPGFAAEETLTHSAGERVLEARSAPLLDGEGNRMGLLIVLADVTRLRQLENLRREFVANVSHELRTPITSIKGFAETLKDGALEDPEQAERFVDIIMRQADRLSGVIEDLLSLSRLDRSLTLERRETRLGEVVEDALEICQANAEETGTELVVEVEEGLRANVNPVLLGQALTNLIDNAIKYAGGKEKKVWITVARQRGDVLFRVRDEGPGIPGEHLPRLFERFYRIDKARSRDLGGTGLGLSIVKNVAQAHGGETSVESELGSGSTFTVRIPIQPNS